MRSKFVVIVVVSLFVVFPLMQALFGPPKCFDCPGYQYGFPFAFREEAGYVGSDRILWLRFLGDQ